MVENLQNKKYEVHNSDIRHNMASFRSHETSSTLRDMMAKLEEEELRGL